MKREQHLLKVYGIITLTINAPKGPVSSMVGYLVRQFKAEREDLIQEVFADYLSNYKEGVYDETKSSIATYTVKFIKWRLSYMVRKHQAEKRKMECGVESYDGLFVEFGDGLGGRLDDNAEGFTPLWEALADLIERYPEDWVKYKKSL